MSSLTGEVKKEERDEVSHKWSAGVCKCAFRFWKGLLSYSKKNNAELILLPRIGKSAEEDMETGNYPEIFRDYLQFKKMKLNSNISIEQFSIRPYQVDPLTGLNRFAQQDTSLIFASPKQRLRPISHSFQKLPKFLMTTGACTRPNYATSADVSAERRRLGGIARRDHIYGALVVEIVDNNIYHFRHIRANSRGEFVDLGVFYSGFKTKEAKLEAMVLGDWHSGQSDYETIKATYEMIATLKPKRVILHDFFDGHSVSHWIAKKPIRERLIHIVDKGLWTLEGELKLAYHELVKLSELVEEVIVVFSNHHAFLHRYLEEGRFVNEPHNFRIAVKLLSFMAEKDHNDPVKRGVQMFGKLPRNVRFLRDGEDCKVRGYQLGAHGDKSQSMGYGSMNTKEEAWGKSCSGHCHKAQIMRNTYTVGTCLPLDMFYMRGYPSDWTHTHALLWDTSTIQLLNIINGKWKL